MKRSDYTYEIKGDIIVITDLNLGRKSVTNDIENILDDLTHQKDINDALKSKCSGFEIQYYDSEGVLTGYNPVTEEFYPVTQN